MRPCAGCLSSRMNIIIAIARETLDLTQEQEQGVRSQKQEGQARRSGVDARCWCWVVKIEEDEWTSKSSYKWLRRFGVLTISSPMRVRIRVSKMTTTMAMSGNTKLSPGPTYRLNGDILDRVDCQCRSDPWVRIQNSSALPLFSFSSCFHFIST